MSPDAGQYTTKAPARRYGAWAGNPKGWPEEDGRCVEEVFGREFFGHQCLRSRGHGPGGLYCRQHGKRHA